MAVAAGERRDPTRSPRLWIGATMALAGVALHWPSFLSTHGKGMSMASMGMDPMMIAGMTMIGIGLLLVLSSLFDPTPPETTVRDVRIHVAEDRRLSWRDAALVGALLFALIVDTMKPATFGFVITGAAAEYHLTRAQVAVWPFLALTGTVTGSIGWGLLGDRAGRRHAVMLSALMFATTSICGAMPSFQLNLLMCFLMGMCVGGLLPLVYTLLTEILPRRHRAWMTVFLGGMGVVGGYLAISVAATLLEPSFGWRVLWLIGGPTGVLVMGVVHFVPESPRYLLLHGRRAEAERIMSRFGAVAEEHAPGAALPRRLARSGWTSLLAPGQRGQSAALGLYAMSLGLVQFGFLTWLPTMLLGLSSQPAATSGLLAGSALLAVPGTLLALPLYGAWRRKLTTLLFGQLVVVPLLGLAWVSVHGAVAPQVIQVLVAILLVGLSATSSMVLAYAAELYPTPVRATASGFVAGANKFGGIVGPSTMAVLLGLASGVAMASISAAAPLLLGSLAVWCTSVETNGQPLDDDVESLIGVSATS